MKACECEHCGMVIDSDAGPLCFVCTRKQAFALEHIDTLMAHIENLERELEELSLPVPPPEPGPPEIPHDVLRLLTYLCHPDLHYDSPAAHTVTKWLLEQRRKCDA